MAARKKKTVSAATEYPQTPAQRDTATRRGYPAAATEQDHARIAAAEARRVARGRRSA